MRRPQIRLLCLCALVGGTGACMSPLEMRQEVITIDGQWRLGEMPKDSFERMIVAVDGLGQQNEGDENRLLAEPDLMRLVLKNPSSLVRADALRSAWLLAAYLPVEPFRVDVLDKTDFNTRTQRLEELIGEADSVAAGNSSPTTTPDGATLLGAPVQAPVYTAETVELCMWLAQFHAPMEAPEIAVSMSEVVVTQALSRKLRYGEADKLAKIFGDGMVSSLRHALVLVTLHAASDPYPVVREEALRSARYLHPDNALALVAGVLARENDSAVVLAALDSLETMAPELSVTELQAAVEPLTASTDVAVKIRIRELLAQHPG